MLSRKFLAIGILLSGLCSWFLWSDYQRVFAGKLEATFWEIPEGDAFLIRTPGGRNIFIDGGIDESVLAKLDRELPFWRREIETLIITHPDLDHLAGGLEVLKKYAVGHVVLSGAMSSNGAFREFLATAVEKDIPIILADQNTDFEIDGVFFDVLFPTQQQVGRQIKSVNDTSLVFRTRFGATSILFTGDIEERAETALLGLAGDLRSTVLKVAHHGSRSSSTPAFLKSTAAEIAIISAGPNNRFGHPHEETVERLRRFGIEVLVTKERGDIALISDGQGVSVETAR